MLLNLYCTFLVCVPITLFTPLSPVHTLMADAAMQVADQLIRSDTVLSHSCPLQNSSQSLGRSQFA